MKKIFGLLTLMLLITVTACDDGEMTVQSFNFTGSVSVCSTTDNVYIKTNGTEALILDLNSSPLLNIEGTRTVSLTNGQVKYRNYSGTTLASIVCSTIDNPDVSVVEEWTGSGTVEIITTKLPVDDSDGTIEYSHTITFIDVSLTKGDETIRVQNTDFGSVSTQLGFKFQFASATETPTQLLECGTVVYTYKNDASGFNHEALQIDFPEGTFNNNVQEMTYPMDDTHALTLKVYSSTVSTSTLCSTNPPLTPVELERWEAVGGTVKIVTTEPLAGTFYHDVYIYTDVVFYNITTAAVSTENFTPVANGSDADGDYYYLGQYVTVE